MCTLLASPSEPGVAQISTLPPSTYSTIAARNAAFVRLLPVIRRHARIRLRHLRASEREEAVQEVVASAFASFARLVARRQGHRAFATPLAEFAVRGFRAGRRTAARRNRFDATSRYCFLQTGTRVDSLHRWDDQAQQWKEIVVEDRGYPPAETAAMRLDFAAWLVTLTRRDRRLATVLATGESTSVVARRFRLTPGRVSQLRRELWDDWHLYVGDRPDDALSAVPRSQQPRRCVPRGHSRC